MEPVIYPTTIAPVAHPDRVKRPEPRRDGDRESAFARYLRRRQEDPDARDSPEDAESRQAAAPAAELRESAGENSVHEAADPGAAKKLIDVRV